MVDILETRLHCIETNVPKRINTDLTALKNEDRKKNAI